MSKLQTESDYTQAMTRLLTLMDADLLPDSTEELTFNRLATSIKEYEEEQIQPAQVSALEALRFRMEQQELTPEDLLPALASAQHVAAILQNQQVLSRSEMTKLQQRFEIPFAELKAILPTKPMNEAK